MYRASSRYPIEGGWCGPALGGMDRMCSVGSVAGKNGWCFDCKRVRNWMYIRFPVR